MHGSTGLWFFISVLAVWRATHLLHGEDGPWDILLRFRRLVGDGPGGRLLGCFYCLSLWVAMPFAALMARTWTEWICLWLGLSGGAILADRVTEPRALPAVWTEEPMPPASDVNEKEL